MANADTEVAQRLAMAERVCALVGITAARSDGDREKALGQAWQDWQAAYGHAVPRPTNAEVAELAARRDEIREATLRRIRGEESTDGR